MALLGISFTFIMAVSHLRIISAAAFSNVIVQRGPVEYLKYDPASFSFVRPQLAQLSAAPLEPSISIPSVPSIVSPCVSPCVINNGALTSLASIPTVTNAKVVALKPTLADIPEARGYQYAYAVFDENTGDKKTQSEHSDGSLVQGQYSFIQPDGFRREVVYTADDSNGFNAVVRNISPEPDQNKEEKPKESTETKKPNPCLEVQNEHLTDLKAQEQSADETSEEAPHGVENLEDAKSDDKSEADKTMEKSEELEEVKETTEKINESAEKLSESTKIDDHEQSLGNTPSLSNAIISYRDIINCLQTKLKGTQNIDSPLTYVLIPSSRGPC